MSSSVFLSCFVKLEEFADRWHIDIDELCGWLKVGASITNVINEGIIPSYVFDIRKSEPFINLSLEDERLVYDLVPIILA